MEPYLKNEAHRKIFRHLLQASYGGSRHTNAKIAATVSCSERTVERVRVTFRSVWLPLVEESRHDFRAWLNRSEGIDRDEER